MLYNLPRRAAAGFQHFLIATPFDAAFRRFD